MAMAALTLEVYCRRLPVYGGVAENENQAHWLANRPYLADPGLIRPMPNTCF